MFPLCLINASVTDAGGIRSRLVSFHGLCRIAFSMVLLKNQTGSALLVYYFCSTIVVFVFLISVWWAPAGPVKQQTFRGWFHFTSPPLSDIVSSAAHYFTLIDMTQPSQQGSLTCADGAPTGLFSHPEIKPSAAGLLLHCWEHSRPQMKCMQAA